MKYQKLFLLYWIFISLLLPQSGLTCTTFFLNDDHNPVVGRTLDSLSEGLLIINKRNISKTAISNPEDSGQPISWTSKYGSVTYTKIAREFHLGGMNEAGLVAKIMILGGTKYPVADSRHYISSIQWIQYQLDNSNSVEQVLKSFSNLRISNFMGWGPYKFQFFVCDRMGNCTIIQFIEGKMFYYTNETLPVKVLSNSPYEESITFLYKHEGWGGDLPIPQSESSLDRFVRAADMVKDYDQETSGPAIDYAFDILSNVTQSGKIWMTDWFIVYDLRNLRIYFRTRDKEQIRFADLSSFDFSCGKPAKVLDIKEDLLGDVSSNFVDYTYEINRELLEKNYPDMTDEMLDDIALYPETTACTEINCFIATAAYGSSMEPQVEVLREFRNRFLLDNKAGKTFLHFYNTYSPAAAGFIVKHDYVRAMVRLGLLPIVSVSWVVLKLGSINTLALMLLFIAFLSCRSLRRWGFLFWERRPL